MVIVFLTVLFQFSFTFSQISANPTNYLNEKVRKNIYENDHLNHHIKFSNKSLSYKSNMQKQKLVEEHVKSRRDKVKEALKQRNHYYMQKRNSKFIMKSNHMKEKFKYQTGSLKSSKESETNISNYEYGKTGKRAHFKINDCPKHKILNKSIASTNKRETGSLSDPKKYFTPSEDIYRHLFNWKEVLILIASSVLVTCSVIICCVSLVRSVKCKRKPKQKSDFKVDTWLASNQQDSGMMFYFPKNVKHISDESGSCRWSHVSKQKKKSKVVCQCSSTNSSTSVA